MRLLVSIHDVMPSTLERVERIFERLVDAGLTPVTLLVVPGTGWDADTLQALRALLARGGQAAGHGWCHRARSIQGLRHRLHSALISRDAAEHLALPRAEIVELIRANHRWFAEQQLPVPTLYVPPAWAMGPVPRRALDELPFDRYETLGGVYDSVTQRFRVLPLVGFEADTGFRAASVGMLNRINRAAASALGRPLRLSIHPDDFELRLGADLARMLRSSGEPIGYDSASARAA